MNSSDEISFPALSAKKILLGVCGSIAAYKAVYLCRLLVKSGAEVRVLMTKGATEFVAPITFATLSKNPVHVEVVQNEQWNDHVEWGLWADLFIVAPITAHTMSKLASGLADNMLTTTYLSAKCPIWIAPAMDLDMWKHPSTQRNLKLLQSDGVGLIDVQSGELASGLFGPGRMAEPDHIADFLSKKLGVINDFSGNVVMVTAGPSQESIDPVRYITNRSSGKMGFAIAESFAQRGAVVHLIHGPVAIKTAHTSIVSHPVKTAREMKEMALQIHPNCDIAVFAAAVSDYRPADPFDSKIKKSSEEINLRLIRNPDIAAECGRIKSPGQYHLGFALETDNEVENARKKLSDKNFDLIALNSLNDRGAGFEVETNKVQLIEQNKITQLELKRKVEVAEDIVNFISRKMNIANP